MNCGQLKDPLYYLFLAGTVGYYVRIIFLKYDIYLSLNSPNSVKTFRENSNASPNWVSLQIFLYNQFQTYMEGGACVSGYYMKGSGSEEFYFAFSVGWFFADYAVPCACFFILYGMVAISMQRRKRDSQFESNRYNSFTSIDLVKQWD